MWRHQEGGSCVDDPDPTEEAGEAWLKCSQNTYTRSFFRSASVPSVRSAAAADSSLRFRASSISARRSASCMAVNRDDSGISWFTLLSGRESASFRFLCPLWPARLAGATSLCRRTGTPGREAGVAAAAAAAAASLAEVTAATLPPVLGAAETWCDLVGGAVDAGSLAVGGPDAWGLLAGAEVGAVGTAVLAACFGPLGCASDAR